MGGFSIIAGNGLGSVMKADNVSFNGTDQGGVITQNGQLLIGSVATPHITVGFLTPGPGIAITNGPGSITIGLSAGPPSAVETLTGDTGGPVSPTSNNINVFGGPGITTSGSGSTLKINNVIFSDTSGTVNLATNNGYYFTTTSTPTLPSAPNQGDMVIVVADTTNPITLTGNTGQKIRLGSTISASAGTAVSTAQGDSLTLRYRTSGATWIAVSSTGNWNVT